MRQKWLNFALALLSGDGAKIWAAILAFFAPDVAKAMQAEMDARPQALMMAVEEGATVAGFHKMSAEIKHILATTPKVPEGAVAPVPGEEPVSGEQLVKLWPTLFAVTTTFTTPHVVPEPAEDNEEHPHKRAHHAAHGHGHKK